MELVLVDGHVKVEDGKPVYKMADGKEVAFDAAGTSQTIGRLNAEAEGHRKEKQALAAQLKPFTEAGITDATEAAKALKIVQGLDQKKLIDAGEVEKVREEVGKAYLKEIEETKATAQKFEKQLYQEKIGGSFARSKFRAEKMIEAFDAGTTEAIFGRHFKVEEGAIIGYDQHGNKLYSRSRPGELADFDEALELLTESHPNKLHILKHNGSSGGGAAGGASGHDGKKTITRAAYMALPPQEQKKAVMEDKLTITD